MTLYINSGDFTEMIPGQKCPVNIRPSLSGYGTMGVWSWHHGMLAVTYVSLGTHARPWRDMVLLSFCSFVVSKCCLSSAS